MYTTTSMTDLFCVNSQWLFTVSWKTFIVHVRLAYKSFLSRISMLINYTMWSSNLFFFFHPAVSRVFQSSGFFRAQVFQGDGFSGSRSFWVRVFQGPGFSESRFFRVQIFQGPGPGFRSSHKTVWSTSRLISVSSFVQYFTCRFIICTK